ncbi:MAG TPA: glycoside hydrolase family 5, partial [Marinilabiliales bacterium]|nr:glycoside hydrolase family 5 [Marinilabiliales bacterium]
DTDTANYNLSTGTYVNWNQGWSYRNDGVDIEKCTDALANNGYSVGWTAAGEWLMYTVQVPAQAAYTFDLRHASGSSGGTIHMEVDGVDVTGPVKTSGTGGWAVWQTKTLENIILPEGEHKIKLAIDKAGCNLNYFKFYNPTEIANADFIYLSSQTYNNGWQVALTLNKEITSDNISASEFIVKVGSEIAGVTEAAALSTDKRILLLTLDKKIYFNKTSYASYAGTSVMSGSQQLAAFTSQLVTNTLPKRQLIPGKIQAENFYYNNGLVLEDCTDTGGGQNTGYAANGDYLDYLVLVNASGDYKFNFRVACTTTNRKLTVQLADSNQVTDLGTITFTNTGGWQTWNTQSMVLPLTNGEHRLRLYITMGEFNLNWFEATVYTDIEQPESNTGLNIFPNPVKNDLQIQLNENIRTDAHISIMNVMGQMVMTSGMENTSQTFKVGFLAPGIYFVEVVNSQQRMIQRIIKE